MGKLPTADHQLSRARFLADSGPHEVGLCHAFTTFETASKINLNAFLTRHAAILGQTGGGTSWTVASVVQKMAAFPQSTIVLFDLHGEYGNAVGPDAEVISAADLELPYLSTAVGFQASVAA